LATPGQTDYHVELRREGDPVRTFLPSIRPDNAVSTISLPGIDVIHDRARRDE